MAVSHTEKIINWAENKKGTSFWPLMKSDFHVFFPCLLRTRSQCVSSGWQVVRGELWQLGATTNDRNCQGICRLIHSFGQRNLRKLWKSLLKIQDVVFINQISLSLLPYMNKETGKSERISIWPAGNETEKKINKKINSRALSYSNRQIN